MQNRRFIELKKWLVEKGLKQRDVARKASRSDSAVRNVMRGVMKSAYIESIFIEMGCPPEILKEEAA
ncbi:MAG: hypothetical protein CVV42_21095 [Candidatus Riflebacteria bacterium HGW-Riflebacteria-2]|nr:MAG: hypothetical protein CVV42_21095 [Candidatus Riflebacteria bacterium HGW-Riflebacteria-2]